MAARVLLKRASGWFAAGREIQQAALLLSDGAFKLFVWLCLHAERASGLLCASAADLGRALQKSEPDITRCLDELSLTGVCRWLDETHIEIQDRFWPYERARPDSSTADSAAYVAAVRRMFLKQACVRSSFTPADDKLATEWRRRGVSLQCVDRAILLGTLRKYAALLNRNGGTPITTLHYFSDLIGEADRIDNSPDYWKYLAHRIQDVELRWRKMEHALKADRLKTK
jgi:hypothetical protein